MDSMFKKRMHVLAALLFLAAFPPYIWAIITNDAVTPSFLTWIVWASVDSLLLFAMLKEGGKSGQLVGAVTGAWIVTILSIFFGELTIGTTEWLVIAGTAVGMALWYWTGKASIAIIVTNAMIFIGSFPTFEKAYLDPLSEDLFAWSIWSVSCVIALLAVEKWDWKNALQPLTFTVIEFTVLGLILIRPLFI